ncbi:ArsR family transcriptional regulator [Halobacteria archaeon AArc-m2/3/4]|uniref:ArsR family transcriptional regulator n=1 Tax=Natronoglomus mannanivorans TaxID=2979990 RepID=A0AAP2Z0R0_9EURY|nr:ArsR family transcriptional regulator [Halobacteria archaeon AArc-xg1-1]MCU4974206.1 ArsR family transcriptional regulator [Halobacteria archaeon AArc-m2/3/4]
MSSVDTSIPDEIRSVAEENDDERLSKDVIFELLKNRRRREVLAYLLDTEETVTLGELAEQLAAWENDTEINALSSDQRKRVYVALYQTHLPKMDDAGIIDYDQDRGLITLSDNADLLMMYLDTDSHRQDRWDRWYAGVSAVGAALVTGAYLGLPPLSFVPTLAVTGLVVAAFLAVSLVHVAVNRRLQQDVDGKLSRIE